MANTVQVVRTEGKPSTWEGSKSQDYFRRVFAETRNGSFGFTVVGEIFVSSDHVSWNLSPTGRRGKIESAARIDLAAPVKVLHPAKVLAKARRDCEQAARDLAIEMLTALGPKHSR